jgi:APA family basic amino acid/polyamine antiporter
MFSMASRGLGPKPDLFAKVDSRTNSTMTSALVGFVMSCFWLMVWYGNFAGWWGRFMDISELPIAILYVIYISLYIWVMREFDDAGFVSRYLAPLLAAAGSCYIIWGAVQKDMFLHFLLLSICIVIGGLPYMNRKRITA